MGWGGGGGGVEPVPCPTLGLSLGDDIMTQRSRDALMLSPTAEEGLQTPKHPVAIVFSTRPRLRLLDYVHVESQRMNEIHGESSSCSPLPEGQQHQTIQKLLDNPFRLGFGVLSPLD